MRICVMHELPNISLCILARGQRAAGKGVSAPGVVLYKQYDNFESIYKGTVSEAELRAWLEEEAAPVLPELDPCEQH